MIFDLQSDEFKAFASDFSGTLLPPSVTVYSTIDKDIFINEAAYVFDVPAVSSE
jgi:hypothetical protein